MAALANIMLYDLSSAVMPFQAMGVNNGTAQWRNLSETVRDRQKTISLQYTEPVRNSKLTKVRLKMTYPNVVGTGADAKVDGFLSVDATLFLPVSAPSESRALLLTHLQALVGSGSFVEDEVVDLAPVF